MNKNTVWILVGVLGLAGIYLYLKKKPATAGAMPFNPGMVGAVQHSQDVTTGGQYSSIANALGGFASSLFGGLQTDPNAIPHDANSPIIAPGTVSNPVSGVSQILPYSYKQQNIDNATLLNTDSLFTPSDTGSGSSGSYADDTGSDSDPSGNFSGMP
jgi:hypothetical protein